jgi:hypothetical protein
MFDLFLRKTDDKGQCAEKRERERERLGVEAKQRKGSYSTKDRKKKTEKKSSKH